MAYVILPTNLYSTADRARAFFDTNFGLRKIRIEEAIDENVNWRPTISGETSDYHVVCIEVTDGGYTDALNSAVAQLVTRGLPVRLYLCYPSDDAKPERFVKTFKLARQHGIGIVEVDAKGKCAIVHRAIDLSLAAVRRTDVNLLLKKHRQAFLDAESTFLDGDPAKGCARVFDEVESLSRRFAQRAADLGWWQPGRLDLQKSAWAKIMGRLIADIDDNIKAVRARCPSMTIDLLNRVSGLTGHRNDSGHRPGTKEALVRRDAQLRTRFEHARDVFIELQDATRPLRI